MAATSPSIAVNPIPVAAIFEPLATAERFERLPREGDVPATSAVTTSATTTEDSGSTVTALVARRRFSSAIRAIRASSSVILELTLAHIFELVHEVVQELVRVVVIVTVTTDGRRPWLPDERGNHTVAES